MASLYPIFLKISEAIVVVGILALIICIYIVLHIVKLDSQKRQENSSLKIVMVK